MGMSIFCFRSLRLISAVLLQVRASTMDSNTIVKMAPKRTANICQRIQPVYGQVDTCNYRQDDASVKVAQSKVTRLTK